MAITKGRDNTILGFQALITEDVGDKSTAIGGKSLYSQNSDSDNENANNVGLGFGSGYHNVTGQNNTFLGTNAGYGASGQSNSHNTGIGKGAMLAIETGAANTVVGGDAGVALTDGHDNVMIGHDAAGVTTTVGYGVFIGRSVASGLMTAAADGTVAIGYNALDALTSGAGNIAVGYQAANALVGASHNVAIGYQALKGQVDGNRIVAIGKGAMGLADGSGSNDSSDNIFIGYLSGGGAWADASSTKNVAIGSYTMDAVLDGALNNTCVGYGALGDLEEGANNTALGTGAGDVITTGSNNVCIGKSTDTTAGNGDNQIVIGYNFTGNGDAKVSLGSDSGYVWNGFTSDNAWAQVSDVRLKKNINDDDLGLEFINEIRPVTFNWKPQSEVDPEFIEWSANNKGEKDTETLVHGFIAQEVKAAMDKVGNTTFNGWEDTIDGQAVKREMFVMPLIKAVQELSQQVEDLKKKVGE